MRDREAEAQMVRKQIKVGWGVGGRTMHACGICEKEEGAQTEEVGTAQWWKSWMGQVKDSVLQVCQLTELKQTKEWERYPNRFRRLYETFLPENLGKHCQEWSAGKTESEIKLLIQENSKL